MLKRPEKRKRPGKQPYGAKEEERLVIEHVLCLMRLGIGRRRIAAALTRAGVPAPSGLPMWRDTTVKSIINRTLRSTAT